MLVTASTWMGWIVNRNTAILAASIRIISTVDMLSDEIEISDLGYDAAPTYLPTIQCMVDKLALIDYCILPC